jgi:hypothetical protein
MGNEAGTVEKELALMCNSTLMSARRAMRIGDETPEKNISSVVGGGEVLSDSHWDLFTANLCPALSVGWL